MPVTLQAGVQTELNVSLTALPATLYGYVTDAISGAPIVGALIQLSGPYAYSTSTNSAGYYEITGIVPGTYNGQVSATNYETTIF